MRAEYSSIAFCDRDRAEVNFARLDNCLPASLRFPLASLLAASPDPDGALNFLERYAARAAAELMAEMAQFPTALTYLVAIFGYSAPLAEAFLSESGLPLQFARDRNFTKLRSREDLMQDCARFSTASPDPWISAQLGQFKRRTTLRIALKDVLGMSTLAETTLELSALADVIVTNALIYCHQELRKRYGEPQFRDAQGRIARSVFSVISLGKMGGNELNYSSDIDLLFLYSYDGETSGGSEPDSVISNKEYFVRLANAITRTITQSTPYGPIYRVDLRLRPEGEMGDAAISLSSALEYYDHRARDWEQQMLIKARHSAGDERLTRDFLRGVDRFIFSSPADFAAIETVLRTRERISKKLGENRNEAVDVKLNRGGIRDIEFLTQCLQRLYGGQDPWVRSGGTLLALRKLNDKTWLSDRDYALLTSSYEFLRKVEHRIQFDLGRQSHRLPTEPEALDRLARRCGIDRTARPGKELQARLENIFRGVDEIYQKVIHPRATAIAAGEYSLEPPPLLAGDFSAISYDSALRFLASQSPELAETVAQLDIPKRAQKNASRYLGQLFSNSELFAELMENPGRLARPLSLIAASEYLGEMLIHHPEDSAALGSVPNPSSTSGTQLEMSLESAAGSESENGTAHEPMALSGPAPAGWGTREQMSFLRRAYFTRRLVLGERDSSGMGPIFSSLKSWSALARECISAAFSIAWRAVKGPLPGNQWPATARFAVLALGRLGVNEFDVASDADLIFVAPAETVPQDVEEWTRLAEKAIEVLSSYTSEGSVFPVDTRLRPLGQEGELVITEDSLHAYVEQKAEVWEALTYLKACCVAGETDWGKGVAKRLLAKVMERFGGEPALEDQLQAMRRRLERELTASPSNPKTAPGGYYDVDFALAYLRLRNSIYVYPGANTLEQLQAVQKAGVIRTEDVETLSAGAAFLRAADHAVRLVTGRPTDSLPEHVGHSAQAEELARRWGLLKSGRGEQPLAWRLREVQQQVRYVYRRVVGSE